MAATSLAKRRGSTITSADWVQFAKDLGVLPQTADNCLSHISAVYQLARPAWGYQLDAQVINDARKVCKALGLTSKSRQRDRRPPLEELDKLMTLFGNRRKGSIPMQEIVCYAIFSTRRQDEITRQTFEDLDEAHPDIWVRDMKHPSEKLGNDVRCGLTPEALAIIFNRRKEVGQTGRIFPYDSGTISRVFTDACTLLGIEDLHFHDLRHDSISCLFELGWNIPNAVAVSGHRTWSSLRRYTNKLAGVAVRSDNSPFYYFEYRKSAYHIVCGNSAGLTAFFAIHPVKDEEEELRASKVFADMRMRSSNSV
ncbi:integrase [Variovorax sp. 1140]|uniref:tyrosine-type recombinase/integrase n=1 Tax=Variovorax atrisoli TaxID=3394203 RepID=UPI0033936DEE